MRNICWYWKQGLPEKLCELMLAEIEAQSFRPGETIQTMRENYRNNDVHFLEENHWLEGIMLNFGRHGNINAGWNFAWDNCERVQISRYQVGQQYQWHADENIAQENSRGRKITIVCQLNKPSDYAGGGLYVEGLDENLMQHQGDIVVFPSLTNHTAKMIDSGSRISAALWMTGPRFV